MNTRLKIPIVYGLDGMHGQTYTLNSTLFPHNLAMAATRNPEYVKAAAKVTANELRASGDQMEFCTSTRFWSPAFVVPVSGNIWRRCLYR